MGLLLFVCSTAALAPACREAGRFLAFRRRKAVGTPKAQINDELRRLHARYPLRIAEPVFHDPATGLLSLDEE